MSSLLQMSLIMDHSAVTADRNSIDIGSHSCVSTSALGSSSFPTPSPTRGASVTSERRFVPQPVGTSSTTHRLSCRSFIQFRSKAKIQPRPRRYIPQLISQSSSSAPMPLRSLSPDYVGGEACSLRPSEAASKVGPAFNSGPPHVQCNGVYDMSFESPLSHTNLLRQQGYQGQRARKLQSPDLSSIESSESEQDQEDIQRKEAIDSSMSSTSPSPTEDLATVEDDIGLKSQPNLLRETCDERVSDYLKSIASRAAEEHVRKRTLAGFSPEQEQKKEEKAHTTAISHTAIDYLAVVNADDSEADEELDLALRNINVSQTKSRRNSTLDIEWELKELRRHKEERQRRAREKAFALGGDSRCSVIGVAAKKAEEGAEVQKIVHQYQTGPEDGNEQTQGVRPPLLGDDIVFPICESPISFLVREPAHHGTATHAQTDHSSLWHPLSVRGTDSETESQVNQGGLWNGCCTKSTSQIPSQPAMWTPSKTLNPLQSICSTSQSSCSTGLFQPQTPPSSSPSTPTNRHFPLSSAHLFQKQRPQEAQPQEEDEEEDIEREFNDQFVTQIYDYLSLGYPCLARAFDEEISKTSGIPIKSLQRDDLNADEKGYIKPPRGDRVAEMIANGECVRWVGLRSYIHDWAKLQRSASQAGNDIHMATAAPYRKGSWGS